MTFEESPSGEFLETIMAAASEYERKLNAERVKAAICRGQRRGKAG